MFLADVKIYVRIKLDYFFNIRALLLARLLNDGINSDDHIHRDVYAEAMAETIKMIELPATIGIFGRWGSGKSFFLKMIKGI